MEFSRQEYRGLPFPSPRDLLDLEIKPGSPALQADSLPSEPPGKLLAPEKSFKNRKMGKGPKGSTQRWSSVQSRKWAALDVMLHEGHNPTPVSARTRTSKPGYNHTGALGRPRFPKKKLWLFKNAVVIKDKKNTTAEYSRLEEIRDTLQLKLKS